MTATVRVVHDAPPHLAGLLTQEIGDLVTIPCPTCTETPGLAYAHSTSPRKTTCHECWGTTTIQIPTSEIDPQPEKCRLCKGRTKLQTLAGYDVLCWVCDGTGDEPAPADPATCARCHDRQTWQSYDGAVEECPTCTAEDAPHPDACTRCDTVTGEALTGSGLCRDCDVDDALADGWIPTHLAGARSGPR